MKVRNDRRKFVKNRVPAVLARYASDRDGALAIEYGLMTALIGVMIITGASALGTELDTMFSDIAALFGGPDEPSVAAADAM